MPQTKWSYQINYRAHFPGDGYAEMSATVSDTSPLDEIRLQQMCVDNLPSFEDMPEGVRPEDIIITRFWYTEMSPVDIPDMSLEGRLDRARDKEPDRD